MACIKYGVGKNAFFLIYILITEHVKYYGGGKMNINRKKERCIFPVVLNKSAVRKG
jgi:hypothetical protein